MNRRVLQIGLLGLLSLTWCLAQRNQLRLEKLADNFYVIFGNGGNTGVLITSKGVLLIDTKFLPDAPEILEKVKSVTDQPVRWVINTHHHGDHVQGNPGMPAMVEIVAHENAGKRMQDSPFFKEPGRDKFVAGRVYKDKLSFFEGKDRVDVYHFGRGHTDGDSVIHFPSLKLIHMGDLFAGRGAPFIDVSGGGSGVAYPKTLAAVVKQFDDKTVERIIPGHNPVLARKDLIEFTEFNREVHAQVAQAVKDGKSLDETKSAFKLAEGKYVGYTLQRLPANLEAIYRELKG